MSIFSSVSYLAVCLYYAWRTTLLFTIELLLFLPLYYFVERHDTQSRWLGYRGEAQLQALLPTAFQNEQADTESESEDATRAQHHPLKETDDDDPKGESARGSKSYETTHNASHLSEAVSSSRATNTGSHGASRASATHTDGVSTTMASDAATAAGHARDAGRRITRCVLARAAVARLRSLRASKQPWWGKGPLPEPLRKPHHFPKHVEHPPAGAKEGNRQGQSSDDESDVGSKGKNGDVSLQSSPIADVRSGSTTTGSSELAESDSLGERSSSDADALLAKATRLRDSNNAEGEGVQERVVDAFFGGLEVCAWDAEGGDEERNNSRAAQQASVSAAPSWCTVVLQRRNHAKRTASRQNDGDARPVVGQYGFLPPWCAVHARAQLLLAYLDPLARMLAELLCLRGWGESARLEDTESVKTNNSEGASVHGGANLDAENEGDDQNKSAASAEKRCGKDDECDVPQRVSLPPPPPPHSSVFVVARFIIAALHSTARAVLHVLCRCAAFLLQHAVPADPTRVAQEKSRKGEGGVSATAGAVGNGNPLRRLQLHLQTTMAHYVADTHHTFEAFDVTAVTVPKNDVWPFMCNTIDGVQEKDGNTNMRTPDQLGESTQAVAGRLHELINQMQTNDKRSSDQQQQQQPDDGSQQEEEPIVAPATPSRPVTSCRRSLGVYWLHGRRPTAAQGSDGLGLSPATRPPGPLVVLLLCPSLLQGSGLYSFAVARLSHICQLLTLAGSWQATPQGTDQGETRNSNDSTARSAQQEQQQQQPQRQQYIELSSPSAAEWYAAVPVVELSTTSESPEKRNAASRPPLTLRDLRTVVHRLRKIGQSSSPQAPPSSRHTQHTGQEQKSCHAEAGGSTRRVVIVGVGWSEAASPLLELAMTQQQHASAFTPYTTSDEKATTGGARGDGHKGTAAASAWLDGLVCLSHSLSSAFQLLPQQRDVPLAFTPSASASSRSALARPHTTTQSKSCTRNSSRSIHFPPHPTSAKSRDWRGNGYTAYHPTPHIPRVLSHLTTGPARLLLLLTRLQLIADNLTALRHHNPRYHKADTSLSARGGSSMANAKHAASDAPPFLYVSLQRFRDAREQAKAVQGGLDAPTLLWGHHQQQQQLYQRQRMNSNNNNTTSTIASSDHSSRQGHGGVRRRNTSEYSGAESREGGGADNMLVSLYGGQGGASQVPAGNTGPASSLSARLPLPSVIVAAASPQQSEKAHSTQSAREKGSRGTSPAASAAAAGAAAAPLTTPGNASLAQHGLRELPTTATTNVSHNSNTSSGTNTAAKTTSAAATTPSVSTRGDDAAANGGRRGSRGLRTSHFAAAAATSPASHERSDEEGDEVSSQQAHPQHQPQQDEHPYTVDSSAYLSALPHLETLTDWEELVHTDAMMAMEARQRREVANATAAHLPHPPSVDSPMNYLAMEPAKTPTRHRQQPAATGTLEKDVADEKTKADETEGSRSGNQPNEQTPTLSMKEKDGSVHPQSASLGKVNSTHSQPQQQQQYLSVNTNSSLRSTQHRMSTDDVIASCSLQSVTPTNRRTTHYPETANNNSRSNNNNDTHNDRSNRSGVSGRSEHGRSAFNGSLHDAEPHGSSAASARDGKDLSASTHLRPLTVSTHEKRDGRVASHASQIEGDADVGQGAAGDGSPLSSGLVNLAEVSFGSPFSPGNEASAGLSFQSCLSAPPHSPQQQPPRKQQDQEERGRVPDEICAARPNDEIANNRDNTSWIAEAESDSNKSTPPQQEQQTQQQGAEHLSACAPTPSASSKQEVSPGAEGEGEVSASREQHAESQQEQQHASTRDARTPSFSPSLHHNHHGQQPSPSYVDAHRGSESEGGPSFTTSRTLSAASSPPPPPIPYPLTQSRSRPLNSQAAALVELRVRSAQHAALIQRIRIPTLLLHARDDPLAPPSSLPFTLLQGNPWLTMVLSRRGSHAVFMESVTEIWRRPYLVLEALEAKDTSSKAEQPSRRGSQSNMNENNASDEVGNSSNNSSNKTIRTHSSALSEAESDSDSDFNLGSGVEGDAAAGAAATGVQTVELRPIDEAHAPHQAGGAKEAHVPDKEAFLRPAQQVDAAAMPRWRLRIEGTTWVERLLFEYVAEVFLNSPA